MSLPKPKKANDTLKTIAFSSVPKVESGYFLGGDPSRR